MTEEEIKQRNESKEFLKDLQYYLFQNKRSPKIDKLSVLLDNDEKRIEYLEKENAELKDEVRKLKLLVSSLVYEINQIWDINEMNDDLRMCAEKIDREVQLSKMAEDDRMVISALGFVIVPPKPKLDVKEV